MIGMLVVTAIAVIPQPREVQLDVGTVPTNVSIVVETDASIAAEGYRLEVRADAISIRSADAAGAFYARQTLEQMREGYQPGWAFGKMLANPLDRSVVTWDWNIASTSGARSTQRRMRRSEGVDIGSVSPGCGLSSTCRMKGISREWIMRWQC